jgi:hypothetical protein
MINDALRSGALVAVLCRHGVLPAAPSPTPQISVPDSASPPTIGEPPAFPPVSRPARIYVAVDWPYYPMHGSPLASRYVLYEDGTFALQYASAKYRFFEYRGAYKEADGLITFDFEWRGRIVEGSRDATGTLSGDSLTVRYVETMQHADFLDGVYIRAR